MEGDLHHHESGQKSGTMFRWLKNIFICVFLGLIFIDSFPAKGRHIDGLKWAIDPIVDYLAIWQGTWDLFSPQIDKQNNWIEVKFGLENSNEPVVWRSPDWKQLSCFVKFRKSREIELYDRIRNDSNSEAWPDFAKSLAVEYEAENPEDTVTSVELISAVRPIASPHAKKESDRVFRTSFFTAQLKNDQQN